MQWGFLLSYMKNEEQIKKFRFGYKPEGGKWVPGYTTLNYQCPKNRPIQCCYPGQMKIRFSEINPVNGPPFYGQYFAGIGLFPEVNGEGERWGKRLCTHTISILYLPAKPAPVTVGIDIFHRGYKPRGT